MYLGGFNSAHKKRSADNHCRPPLIYVLPEMLFYSSDFYKLGPRYSPFKRGLGPCEVVVFGMFQSFFGPLPSGYGPLEVYLLRLLGAVGKDHHLFMADLRIAPVNEKELRLIPFFAG